MFSDFHEDKVYKDVFMIFVDASGHSNIVKNNPSNLASKGFDLLEERLKQSIESKAQNSNCEIACVWSWLGDGGMFAVYDKDENRAMNAAISFSKDILTHDLPIIRLEFDKLCIAGDLHVRIAIHKGTISYTKNGQQGSIHSSDINWGAHLEKATPKDTVAISKEIFDILPASERKGFVSVGEYEERKIYLFNNQRENCKEIELEWASINGFEQMERIQCYHERLSQNAKAILIRSASKKVIDFGTTLNTCSGYLDSTERPVPYRDAVKELLNKGGTFSCYIVKPNSEASNELSTLRHEDSNMKISRSLERFSRFKQKNGEKRFEVFAMNHNPNMAAMFFDPDSENAVCLYSPYINSIDHDTGRADMPHYLISKKQPAIYNYIWNIVNAYIKDSEKYI